MRFEDTDRREVGRGLNGCSAELCTICSLPSFGLHQPRHFCSPTLRQRLTVRSIVDQAGKSRLVNSRSLSIFCSYFPSHYTSFQISNLLWPRTFSLQLNSEYYQHRTAMVHCLLACLAQLAGATFVQLLLSLY